MHRAPVLVHNTHITHTTPRTQTHTHRRVGFPAFHSCPDCKVPRLTPVPILLLIGEQWDSNPEHLGCEPSVLTMIPPGWAGLLT